MPRTTTNRTTPLSESGLMGTMRAVEILHASEMCTVPHVLAALARIPNLVADPGENPLLADLEAFIHEHAKKGGWEEVLTAAENEGPFTWKSGSAFGGGDFMNTYVEPALVYGIALGLYLATNAALPGGVR